MNKNKEKKYTAVIVGAGAVAQAYDSPQSKEITTHAHGFTAHENTTLCGFFDVDFKKASLAAEKWGTRAYKSLEEMFAEAKPDIVSICTPDASHASLLKTVLKYKPKLIIAEKPLTTDSASTKEILKLYQEAGIPIIVNYRRRYDAAVLALRDRINAGEIGEVLGASAVYSKGLLHSGSHMIDLARFLFGEVISAKALFKREDNASEDPTVGGFLIFSKCPAFNLLAGDERTYSLFELDILGTKERIRFVNEGLEIETQTIIHDSKELLQKGYSVLGKKVSKKTDLTQSALRLVQNAVNNLTEGEAIISTGNDAAKTEEICFDLGRQLLQSNK